MQFAGTPPAAGNGANATTVETDPYGKITTYIYDTGDRTVNAISPLGANVSGISNTNNDATASTSAENQNGGGSTAAAYNSSTNNLTSVTDPTGASESATYDDTNNPYQADTTTTDQGIKTTYTRNNDGQVTSAKVNTSQIYARHQGDAGVANCGPGTSAPY